MMMMMIIIIGAKPQTVLQGAEGEKKRRHGVMLVLLVELVLPLCVSP